MGGRLSPATCNLKLPLTSGHAEPGSPLPYANGRLVHAPTASRARIHVIVAPAESRLLDQPDLFGYRLSPAALHGGDHLGVLDLFGHRRAAMASFARALRRVSCSRHCFGGRVAHHDVVACSSHLALFWTALQAEHADLVSEIAASSTSVGSRQTEIAATIPPAPTPRRSPAAPCGGRRTGLAAFSGGYGSEPGPVVDLADVDLRWRRRCSGLRLGAKMRHHPTHDGRAAADRGH
jgi:hypothetical protein